MNLTFKCLSIFIVLFLLLGGCSSNQNNENNSFEGKSKDSSHHKTKEKDQKQVTATNAAIKVDPFPTTYEELAELPVGDYAKMNVSGEGSDAEIKKVFSDLPNISGNRSENELDQYYRELLKRVQQDYEGPENLIKRLRFQSLGSPDSEDTRYKFKDHLNVEFIIDASGSMAQVINGKQKMDSAKDSILKFVSSLPKDAKVGIRVYGHKGSGADADKKISCSSSENVYSISNYNERRFNSALNKFSPNGWTPIGLAMKEAKKDLSAYDGKDNTNIVYLVSDGIDTCDDDPISAAKELYTSNISPIINVIGFDVDSKGENQLKTIANATHGIYDTVNNEVELQKELDKLVDITKDWKTWLEQGKQHIESKKLDNGLDIFSYITEEGSKASDEGTKIYLILHTLYEANYFNSDSYAYLEKKNSEYHKWINEEISKFNEELRALNDKSYNDAVKELEEKYNANTQ